MSISFKIKINNYLFNLFVTVISLILISCSSSNPGNDSGENSNTEPSPSINSINLNNSNIGGYYVGDTLSAIYTFVGIDGEQQGASTFQWYRDNVAIPNETTKSYTLVSSDVDSVNGKAINITLQITPVTNSGKIGTIEISDTVSARNCSLNGNSMKELKPSLVSNNIITNDGFVWLMGSTLTKMSRLRCVVGFAAGRHNLVLLDDGTLWGYGNNDFGQLGNGTTSRSSNSRLATKVLNLTNVKAVMSESVNSDSYSLALLEDGTVWSWGKNTVGELGDETNTDQNIPVQVSGLTNVQAISTQHGHSLALHTDGTVSTWGRNTEQQLGDGTKTNRNKAFKLQLSDVKAVNTGYYYSIALHNDGTVTKWGGNGNTGALTQIPNFSSVKAISTGLSHSLALHNDGTVSSWGSNIYGELGNGTRAWNDVPTKISDLNAVHTVIAYGSASFSLSNDCDTASVIRAWGFNNLSVLGFDSGYIQSITRPSLSTSLLKQTCIENIPPSVIETNPYDTDPNVFTNVSAGLGIIAMFNEPMEPTSINSKSFILSGSNGASIAGTISYDKNIRIAKFTSTNKLSPNQKYTASITTAATDMAGNPLKIQKDWSFSTVVGITMDRPNVQEGAAGTTTNVTYTVTLDNALAIPLSMVYSTKDGSATVADNDYIALGIPTPVTLTFPAGSTTATIDVQINGDNNVEPDETFQLILSKSSDLKAVFSTGTPDIPGAPVVLINPSATINNDD